MMFEIHLERIQKGDNMHYTELSFSESSTRTQNRPNQQAFDAMVHKEKGGFYPNLDLAKFVCALLVVVIHTSPLENTAELAHFYLNNVFARVAVPLFFAASVPSMTEMPSAVRGVPS